MYESPVRIAFVKMSGAGNDFVLIDNTECVIDLDWPKLAAKLCERRLGVGADGLIVIERGDSAPFRMNYYNSDGSFGGMCGNGGRCSARYLMEKERVGKIDFESLGHTYSAIAHDADVILQMKDVNSCRWNIKLQIAELNYKIHFLDTGSPHVVVPLEGVDAMKKSIQENGVIELGRSIRSHEDFAPDGTNVNFVELLYSRVISMRTYERGVENETLACGTGAVASALCYSMIQGLESPVSVLTRGGEILKVYFKKMNTSYVDVRLEGSARVVFYGSLLYLGEHDTIVSSFEKQS